MTRSRLVPAIIMIFEAELYEKINDRLLTNPMSFDTVKDAKAGLTFLYDHQCPRQFTISWKLFKKCFHQNFGPRDIFVLYYTHHNIEVSNYNNHDKKVTKIQSSRPIRNGYSGQKSPIVPYRSRPFLIGREVKLLLLPRTKIAAKIKHQITRKESKKK